MTQTITIAVWAVAIAVAVWALLQKRNWVILLMMAVLVGVSVYWIIPPGVKTRLGPRSAGRPAGRLHGQDVGRQGADVGAARPDRQHPRPPRQRPRRHRVADPEAGQRPDLGRAARHQERRAGARHHRQDRPAPVLQGRPALAAGRPGHQQGRGAQGSSSSRASPKQAEIDAAASTDGLHDELRARPEPRRHDATTCPSRGTCTSCRRP